MSHKNLNKLLNNPMRRWWGSWIIFEQPPKNFLVSRILKGKGNTKLFAPPSIKQAILFVTTTLLAHIINKLSCNQHLKHTLIPAQPLLCDVTGWVTSSGPLASPLLPNQWHSKFYNGATQTIKGMIFKASYLSPYLLMEEKNSTGSLISV